MIFIPKTRFPARSAGKGVLHVPIICLSYAHHMFWACFPPSGKSRLSMICVCLAGVCRMVGKSCFGCDFHMFWGEPGNRFFAGPKSIQLHKGGPKKHKGFQCKGICQCLKRCLNNVRKLVGKCLHNGWKMFGMCVGTCLENSMTSL